MKRDFRILLIWLALAVIALHRPPWYASNMESFPDSGEYVTMALRSVTEQTIKLPVQDRELPSRYQPWFSLMVLAPGYLLTGREPGNGIFPVLLFGVAGLGLVGFAARRISGWVGGVVAMLLALATDYVPLSRKILSDVPAAILATAMAFGFADSDLDNRAWRIRDSIVMVAFACAVLWRPAYIVFALPLMIASLLHRRWLHLKVFASVCAAVIGLQLAYNAQVFGAPFRTGYAFWIAAAFDNPADTLSWAHWIVNLRKLAWSRVGVVWGIALIVLAVPSLRRGLVATSFGRNILFFWAWSLPCFAALHLGYFFADTRFFLPVTVGLCALAGAGLGQLWHWSGDRFAIGVGVTVLVSVVIWRLFIYQPLPPLRRIAANKIAELTPSNATVISAIDPVYLRLITGPGDKRRFVPLSRKVEYASKQVHMDWITDRRGTGLHQPRFEPAVRWVAVEQVEQLERDAREGKPVYLDMTHVDDYDMRKEAENLLERFEAEPVSDRLYRLIAVLPQK